MRTAHSMRAASGHRPQARCASERRRSSPNSRFLRLRFRLVVDVPQAPAGDARPRGSASRLMRAANLMRGVHRRSGTRLSRNGNHPPGSTPNHSPVRACAPLCRGTVARIHKGYKPCQLMRDACRKPDARCHCWLGSSAQAMPPTTKLSMNEIRAAANWPKWQTAARRKVAVQLACQIYIFVQYKPRRSSASRVAHGRSLLCEPCSLAPLHYRIDFAVPADSAIA